MHMERRNDIKLVEVFAGELYQATMIKNLLEDNNIQAHLQDEHMGVIQPWVVASGGFNAVKVIVSNLDYGLSVKLIEELNNAPNE